MKIQVPENVTNMIVRLNEAGFDAYAVGGCVRDSLLGITPHDWDIATGAKPEMVKLCFSGCRIVDTGLKHGTVTVFIDGMPVEVTTYRIDGDYGDCRRPDSVEFTNELRMDLSRRDFTVNALAYHPERGVVDYFGGLQDLKAHRIVCVGDASKRFSEDALRVLRAVRFSAVLGFSIEQGTLLAMTQCVGLLDKISSERICSELSRTLTGKYVLNALLKYTGIFTETIPELAPMVGFDQHSPYHEFYLWDHTAKAVDLTPPDLILRMTMLLHDCAKPETFTLDRQGTGRFYGHAGAGSVIADRILGRLRYDNATRNQIAFLIKHHCDHIKPEPKLLKRLLNRMGADALYRLIAVKRADYGAKAEKYSLTRQKELDVVQSMLDKIISQNQAFCIRDLAVNGNDLLELGFSQGKALGDALQTLLRLVIDEQLENDHEALLAAAKELMNR